MMPTNVSVVISTWNRKTMLAAAIDSVVAQQDAPSFEIVVVNDGSDDATEAFLAELGRTVRAVTIDHTGNLATVRNKGLEIARGNYVLLLDDDDLLERDALKRLAGALDENDGCGFAFGDVRYVEEDGTVGPPFLESRYNDDRDVLWNLVAGTPLFSQATIARRSLLTDVGGLDTSRPSAEDFDLWLRVALQADGVRLRPVVTRLRRHARNMSASTAIAGCENAAASLEDLLGRQQLTAAYRAQVRRTLCRLYRQVSALYLQRRQRREASKFAALALRARPISARSWMALLRAQL